MAAVLLALGVPLAVSVAGAQQQKVVVDRIDDTARFAALAQFVTDTPGESNERRATLDSELTSYFEVYGSQAGVFYANKSAMAKAPNSFALPAAGVVRAAYDEALLSRRSHDPH